MTIRELSASHPIRAAHSSAEGEENKAFLDRRCAIAERDPSLQAVPDAAATGYSDRARRARWRQVAEQ